MRSLLFGLTLVSAAQFHKIHNTDGLMAPPLPEASWTIPNWENLNYFYVTRNSKRRVGVNDFVVQLNIGYPHDFLFDIGTRGSWIQGGVGYSPSECASTSGIDGSAMTVCSPTRVRAYAGNQVSWNVFIYRSYAAGSLGVIGANVSSGFFSKFMLIPNDKTMVVVVSVPASLETQVCATGHMHFTKLISGEERRVYAHVGISGRNASSGNTILSTRGSIELAAPEWQSFRALMRNQGRPLTMNAQHGGYVVSDCTNVGEFPTIRVEIAGLGFEILPKWFTYPIAGSSQCFIDVKPATGGLRLGPSFLRNVVSLFDGEIFGVCVPKKW